MTFFKRKKKSVNTIKFILFWNRKSIRPRYWENH